MAVFSRFAEKLDLEQTQFSQCYVYPQAVTSGLLHNMILHHTFHY